ILYKAVKNGDGLTEITLLDVSDYHAQVIPLSEPADTLGPTFAIGGSAFLKPWFDAYTTEAPQPANLRRVTAGDSVGAPPPISNFFGDTPAYEFMNMVGMDLDTLGNHNSDRGQDYLRHTLMPIAHFPFVTANVVDPNGKTPPEWSPSTVFKFGSHKVGF